MRWRAVCSVLAAAVGLAACSPAPIDATTVDTCERLDDVAVRLVHDYLETFSSLELDVLTGEAPPPPVLTELQTRGADLDARVAALGCDVAVINAAAVESVEGVEPNNDAEALFLDVVRAGIVADLPLAPNPASQ